MTRSWRNDGASGAPGVHAGPPGQGSRTFGESDTPSGADLQVFATPFGIDHPSDDDPERLVVGQVAPTAQEVRVTWSDGTFVDVKRQGEGAGKADPGDPRIVEVKGAEASWFVALAPEGVQYRSVEVALTT
ncbi:hypothetical protein [Streptomyces sp. NPDC057438]|uniref:hypothetical protein n=1 Tax=Streptomyces sp. NPDC057438 TaxID=3346133 RepID=UPI0036CB5099